MFILSIDAAHLYVRVAALFAKDILGFEITILGNRGKKKVRTSRLQLFSQHECIPVHDA